MRSLIAGLEGSRFLGKLNVRHTATWVAGLGAMILLAVISRPANAQTFTTLLSFNGTNGKNATGSLTLIGTALYGTTSEGGANGLGNIFSINTDGSGFQNLFSFSGTNGQWPQGSLTLSGTTLYGTTNGGGANSDGTVFSVGTNGSGFQSLVSFNETNGTSPNGSLMLSGTTIYGVTQSGGTNGCNCGTVFSISTTGGSLQNLASFSATNGENPIGSLTLSGTALYGMTSYGGASYYGGDYGTVFSVPVSGGIPTALLSFTGTNGANPYGSLTLSGTTLYGMTSGNYGNGKGNIFSIGTNGTGFQNLFSFSSSSGYFPCGGLTLSGTTLYGMTEEGGAYGYGTIFSIPVSGGTLTTLASFNGFNGANPYGNLTLSGSILYGTTTGGLSGLGTVFALNITPAIVGLSNVSNATIISGGTAMLGTTVSNSISAGYNLNYTMTAAVQSGSATLGSITSGTGSLAPSTSHSCTVSVTSTNLGTNTISFTASDPNASNSAQTTTGTLTVLGHAAPSLSVATGNSQTVIVGATGITAGLNLSNGTSGQSGLASLDVDSLGSGVSGSTGYKLVSSGSAQSYTASLSTGTLGTQVETFSLNVGDDHTSTGVTLTVLGHAAPSLSVATGNSQTVIVGATGITAGLNLSNGTSGQSGLASLDVDSLGSGVSGSTGYKLVSSGSAQSYTASLSTGTLGTQVETFSLNVGDDHTLSGASSAANTSTGVTLTVLGHAAPSLSVATGNSQTVIVGATGITAGLNLSNGTSGQSGLASLDVDSLGSGVSGSTGYKLVSSGSAQSYTASLSTGTLGTQVETFSLNVGDDHTLSGASSAANTSTGVTLTVFDHSNASLSSTANQTIETINFGNLLKGATSPIQSFTLYNRAANASAADTANLKETGFTATGDAALTTTLSPFGGLSAGGYVTYYAALDTSNYTTTGTKTVVMSASQLVDDSSMPGAGSNNNGAVTVTLQGNVGNATADKSNSPSAFGPALTAPVAQGASYANLESTVKTTTGSGGQPMVGSTATILAGTASASTNVSMAWRTATTSEGLVSDVLGVEGIEIVDGETKDGSVHTDTFVLQMSYNPQAVTAKTGLTELAAAQAGRIQMDYLDLGPNGIAGAADNQWENAVLGNFGSNNDTFVGVGAWNGEMTLGDWGVNTANHTVWAVLDHNSEFAVVPEPGTFALLGVGAIGLFGWAWRRRSPHRTPRHRHRPASPPHPWPMSLRPAD